MLKGINTDSKDPASFLFSLKDVENIFSAWDETLRRWKDTRALIHPSRIIFKDQTKLKKLYLCIKKTEAEIYGEENKSIFKILKNSLHSVFSDQSQFTLKHYLMNNR